MNYKIIDKNKVVIGKNVKIGAGTIIYPFVVIEDNVVIGKNCKITYFAHIGNNVQIGNNCEIGNYVEIVRSTLDDNIKIKHHAFIGDTTIYENVNIGAGVKIANWNGITKEKTIIRSGCSIGCNVVIIAPNIIQRRCIIGAGSIILKNTKFDFGETWVGNPGRKI